VPAIRKPLEVDVNPPTGNLSKDFLLPWERCRYNRLVSDRGHCLHA
jgi:hypothetical protein